MSIAVARKRTKLDAWNTEGERREALRQKGWKV